MDGSKTPSERTWIVGPQEIPQDRALTQEELPTAADLAVALQELGPILERIGGVATIAVEKAPTSVEGVYVPIRYVFRWHSFVPARSDVTAPTAQQPSQNGEVEEPAEEPVQA